VLRQLFTLWTLSSRTLSSRTLSSIVSERRDVVEFIVGRTNRAWRLWWKGKAELVMKD